MQIPWLVNGTLSGDAEEALRAHLAACPRCREDYQAQERLRAAMRSDTPLVFASESSFQKLLARFGSGEFAARPGAVHRRLPGTAPRQSRRAAARTRRAVRWLAAAAVLEALALGLLGWVWRSGGAGSYAPYVTLTSPAPSYHSAERARVVFSPDLTLGQLQNILRAVHARIIEGPAAGNVYTLGFAPPPASQKVLQQRIAALRASPAVLFAEPISRDASPP